MGEERRNNHNQNVWIKQAARLADMMEMSLVKRVVFCDNAHCFHESIMTLPWKRGKYMPLLGWMC